MDITTITIFVLAIFVGFEIITKVPPTLHTPLMSGSNAISGIAIIGAILSTVTKGELASVLGFFAVVFAMINVVGGFMVTDRMLKMFKRKLILQSFIINLVYLIAAVCFIYGLKMLSHPKTARNGNLIASIGMLIAIVITVFAGQKLALIWIFIAMIIGSIIGAFFATSHAPRVKVERN